MMIVKHLNEQNRPVVQVLQPCSSLNILHCIFCSTFRNPNHSVVCFYPYLYLFFIILLFSLLFISPIFAQTASQRAGEFQPNNRVTQFSFSIHCFTQKIYIYLHYSLKCLSLCLCKLEQNFQITNNHNKYNSVPCCTCWLWHFFNCPHIITLQTVVKYFSKIFQTLLNATTFFQ